MPTPRSTTPLDDARGAPPDTRPDARSRILGAAMALFADRGYARTTVRQIEEAAGFSPGAGGIYRYFGSKADVLAAAIRQTEAEGEGAATVDGVDAEVLSAMPLRDALAVVARGALDALARQADLMRVLFRDLDDFPDLRDEFRERQVQRTYAAVAAWLDGEVGRRGLPAVDSEALAVVGLGALVNYRLIGTLLGEAPGPIEEDRLVEMWAEVVARRLEPDPHAQRPAARGRPAGADGMTVSSVAAAPADGGA